MAWGIFKKIGDGIKKGWNSVVKPVLGTAAKIIKPVAGVAGGLLNKVKPGLGTAVQVGANLVDGLLNKKNKKVRFNPVSDDEFDSDG